MFKRIVIMTVISALVLSLFASCGIITLRDPHGDDASDTSSDVTTAAPVVTQDTGTADSDKVTTAYKPVEVTDNLPIAKQYLDALPEWDFEGIGISIVTTDRETFSPSGTESVVYNARIERNNMVEDKYNTMVMVTSVDAGTLYDQLAAAVKADDYYADIIGLPQNVIGRFQAQGLLMNLMSLPFTDYTQPYYNTQAIGQLTAGHAIYGTVGDFNENLDYIYGLFFNRDMAKSLGFDPYAEVYNGTWDWEAFRRMTIAAASIDGGALIGHGAAVDINTYESILFASSGIDFFDTGWGKVPSLDFASDKTKADATDRVVRAIRNVLYGDGSVFTDSKGAYSIDGAGDAFYAGGMLFYTDRMYYTSWITDMADNWGLLPFPDNGDGYHSFCDTSFPIVCVPYGSSNTELTGLFMQAANAASYGWLDDVFYENLQVNIIRDSDTLNMLDIISGRRGGEVLFSFAYMFGGQYKYVADATYGALYSSTADNITMSTYQQAHEKNVESRLAKVFTMLS